MSTAESADSAQVSRGSMCRLAVYGTLAPGRPNHHQLSGLSGRWIEGTVRGQLLQEGWGSEDGYPGIVLDGDAPTVDVQLFESSDLPDHWTRLDEFEGSGYRRTLATVSTAEGDLLASIYVLTSHRTKPKYCNDHLSPQAVWPRRKESLSRENAGPYRRPSTVLS